MDTVINLSNRAANMSNNRVDWGAVFKTNNLSPRIQTHLVKVYATLALTVLACCVGVAADIAYSLGGIASALGCVCILIALGIDADKTNWQKRVSLLGLYGFLQGTSLGPLIALVLDIDPAILFTAILGTGTIFVCFSLSAIYAQRRSYLYLGGMLSSACMFMFMLQLVTIFYKPMFVYSIELYIGLAIFSAYVLYDSQMIIEKCEQGSDDFVWHALQLFIDLMQIFIRLLILLAKNNKGKKKSDKESSESRR